MKHILHLLTLLTLSLTTSCSKPTRAEQETDSTIRLGVLPTMESVPFYYADSTGIFDSLGLDIKLITFDAAMDADTAMAGGSIDAILSDLVKATTHQANGDSIHIVLTADLHLWLITSHNSRILRSQSLKDKIIGITRNSALDFFADQTLLRAQLQPIDLNRPQINSIRLRTIMVDQNQYDGAILPEPFASEAVARGARRLDSSDDHQLHGLLCLYTPDSTYRRLTTQFDLLLQAYDQAVGQLNADSMSSPLHYIPEAHRLYLPDTLYTHTPFTTHATPSDSTIQLINNWLRDRKLINTK
ncbi:MAG: hypothetical protein Q4P12_01090 [Bacteroidales bacterium]|nr:hypothetical protein [Bacteroidales bacterium]